MAIEIECIIDNNFNKSEIIKLPTIIDKEWKDLRGIIEKESANFSRPFKKRELDKEAKWGFDDLSEEEIEYYWRYFESNNPENSHSKNDIWFFCYFGMIKIYRNVIVINPLNLRYKAFRNEVDAKRALVKIVRAIIRLFGVEKVLYCADSSSKTEVLSDMASLGKNLSDIIQFGESRFGKPSPDYKIGIEETYFIDYLDQELK